MNSIKKKYTPPKLEEYKQNIHTLENVEINLTQRDINSQQSGKKLLISR